MREGGRRVVRNAAVNAHVKKRVMSLPGTATPWKKWRKTPPIPVFRPNSFCIQLVVSDHYSIDHSLELETVLSHVLGCESMGFQYPSSAESGHGQLAVSNALLTLSEYGIDVPLVCRFLVVGSAVVTMRTVAPSLNV